MEKKTKKGPDKFLKYMNLAFQMIFVILVFAYLGVFLDGKFETGPYLTALFSLMGVFLGLYFALKDFLIQKK